MNLSSLFPVQQLETKMHIFGWPVLTMYNDMHHSLIQIIIYVITRRSFRSPTPFLFVNYLLFFHAEKFFKTENCTHFTFKAKMRLCLFSSKQFDDNPSSLDQVTTQCFDFHLKKWGKDRHVDRLSLAAELPISSTAGVIILRTVTTACTYLHVLRRSDASIKKSKKEDIQ